MAVELSTVPGHTDGSMQGVLGEMGFRPCIGRERGEFKLHAGDIRMPSFAKRTAMLALREGLLDQVDSCWNQLSIFSLKHPHKH